MSNFFLPYQARWITDPSRKRLMVKSRQIGISLSTAYDLVLKSGKRSCRFDTWASSRDEFQAQLFAADQTGSQKKLKKRLALSLDSATFSFPCESSQGGERPCSRLRVKAGGHNNT